MKIKDEIINVLIALDFTWVEKIDLCKNYLKTLESCNIGKKGITKFVSKEWPALRKIGLGYSNAI